VFADTTVTILEFAASRPNATVRPTVDDPMLRRIGYWKECLRDDYPFAQELRAEYTPGLADKLATYLESGKLFDGYLGDSWCRFGCPGDNGSTEVTDGVWVWPTGLVHYIRHHPVALPADFLRDATSMNSPASAFRWPPALVQRADDSYWIGWARTYRASTLNAMLEEGRAVSSRACETMLDAAGIEHTTMRGSGTRTCITADCSRKTSSDTAFCGRCLAERDRKFLQMKADSVELGKVFRLLPGVLAERPPQRL
jgi:hypothetical protein